MSSRDDYLDLLAQEYRVLATSGNQADQHTYTALQWGTAFVGVIAAAGLSQWRHHDAVVELVFLLVIPAVVALGMFYWLGELARMRRIYDFMCLIEAKAALALRQRDGTSRTHNGWTDSFSKVWDAKLPELTLALELDLPVAVNSDPITFERWLRAIRNNRASQNLTWVFQLRFALFPAAIVMSLVLGIYYTLWVSATLDITAWLRVAGTTLLGTIFVWLGLELALDLDNSSSKQRVPRLPRRVFRNIAGSFLQIPNWRRTSDPH
jgi:hypothetical protein